MMDVRSFDPVSPEDGETLGYSSETVFDWADVPGALLYEIEVYYGVGAPVASETVSASILHWNVIKGGDYTWRVRAICDVAESPYTKERDYVRMPGFVDSLHVNGWFPAMALSAGICVLAEKDGGVYVLDVGTSSKPRVLGTCGVSSFVTSVAVGNGAAYVGIRDPGFWEGFYVLDVSNPSSPVVESLIVVGAVKDIKVNGAYLYVLSDSLRVYSIAMPSAPTQIAGVAFTEGRVLAAQGSTVSVQCSDGTIFAVDVSIPSQPSVVGQLSLSDVAWDAEAVGGYLYLACLGQGLHIIDASTPSQMREIGICAMDCASGIAVDGQYAYVACAASGLRVINVSDPSMPVVVGEFQLDGYAAMVTRCVAVVGENAIWSHGGDAIVVCRVQR